MLRCVGKGMLAGAMAGCVAAAVLVPVGLALAARDFRAVHLLALVVGMYAGSVGALYGLVAGGLVALAASPVRHDPRMLGRLRPVWGLLAAGLVWVISLRLFGWDMHTGVGQTAEQVRERLYCLYLLPSLAAGAAGAVLTPRLITEPLPEPAPFRI